MKTILPIAVCSLAGMLVSQVHAQSAKSLADGKTFAESIAPQTSGQLVNPSGVSTAAWDASGTSMPTTTPPSLGTFSAPLTGSSLSGVSGAPGALSGLGVARIQDCKNTAPTGDPIADQECAAVKFMNRDCLPLSAAQQQIMGASGAAVGAGTDCSDTFGEAQSHIASKTSVATSDPIFQLSASAQSGAPSTAGQSCVPTTVITTPAVYQTNECSKLIVYEAHTCTRDLDVSTTIAYSAPTPYYTCPAGALQGAQCVVTTSAPASPTHACPPGQVLDGLTCVLTSTTPAILNYACALGSALIGAQCKTVLAKATWIDHCTLYESTSTSSPGAP